jgi:SMC interacting uncharacterized protein involved in chromosome segregation
MPRSQATQDLTNQLFLNELRRASNAFQLLRLYNIVVQDAMDNEQQEFLETMQMLRTVVEKKEREIAALKARLEEIQQNVQGPKNRLRLN